MTDDAAPSNLSFPEKTTTSTAAAISTNATSTNATSTNVTSTNVTSTTATTATAALVTHGLSKSFGTTRHAVTALADVSVAIPTGAVVALVGGNGAGKSTFLRILSGALTPGAGRISILGHEVPAHRRLVRNRLGVLSGSGGGLYDRLTAREHLQYVGRLRGMRIGTIQHRIDEVASQVGLTSFLDRRCGTFSTGMRQRTALAAAVFHRPEVILLDEPTTGLDIHVRSEIQVLIRSLADGNATLVISTHHPEEIQPVVTHLMVLERGRLVAFEPTGSESLHKRCRVLMGIPS